MISLFLTLEKISSNHENAEFIKIACIRHWRKIEGKELFEVAVDEVRTEPDTDCVIFYTLPNQHKLDLFVLHNQDSYKVVDQRIQNRMTLDLLSALKKCDMNELKRLANVKYQCEHHDYDEEGDSRICLNCGHKPI